MSPTKRSIPRSKPTWGNPCPVCGRRMLKWADGTQRCIKDHSTAADVLRAAEKRSKR